MEPKTNVAATGASLTEAVNNIPNYQAEAAEIEQWLNKRGHTDPYSQTMKALHDLVTEGSPLYHATAYSVFINSLRGFLLQPGRRSDFLDYTNASDAGITDYFNRLEQFFFALQSKIIQAEVNRFGLLNSPEQYNEGIWGGIEYVMEPYRTE